MPDRTAVYKAVLAEKLAESTTLPTARRTRRAVHGIVRFEGKATAVVGMRRAGKTTYLHQMRSDRVAEGMARDRVPYINFEDERLEGMDATHLDFILQEFRRGTVVSGPGAGVFWCLDEVQLVPGWERFVRRLLDDPGNEVAVTGSSASLLSREIATSLRGRAWEVPLYPFSFHEYLIHHGVDAPQGDQRLTGQARATLEKYFLTWLEHGGMPEAQGLPRQARYQLLRDYVDVAMLRDVIERHRVSNVVGLRWLVRHLLGNAGGLFSVEKFHGSLKSQGIAISRDTVHQLLAYLEDCFLVKTLWMEASSERQRMVNPRKAYPVDSGLIPVYDRSGRGNHGHALETAVLVELCRRRCDVTYVTTRGGFEVDFLARHQDGHEELIQVCYDASDPATHDREIRSLVEAAGLFPGADQRLLVATADGLPRSVPAGVQAELAYAWMLRGLADS